MAKLKRRQLVEEITVLPEASMYADVPGKVPITDQAISQPCRLAGGRYRQVAGQAPHPARQGRLKRSGPPARAGQCNSGQFGGAYEAANSAAFTLPLLARYLRQRAQQVRTVNMRFGRRPDKLLEELDEIRAGLDRLADLIDGRQ